MKLTPLDPWIAHKIGRDGQPVVRADLEAYQLEKLRETLRLARERSRFYRERLSAAPIDLGSLDDIAVLSFTTADDIRANPLHFLCVSQDDIRRVVTLQSSGTTGEPKRLYFTREDQELTVDFFHVGMSTFTAPGDRVLILLSGETPGSVGDLLTVGLERWDAAPVKHGPVRDVGAVFDVVQRERINVLVGVPVHVLALARRPDGSLFRLKSVLLSTDHVPEAIKSAIETAFACTVYNHYGMTEMGLGGGVECEARRGYHLREADLLFEIVDPVTGVPLPDGDYGEIVFTTLTRRGMPLIRYRTGDVSRFLPGECPCGTRLKTLERVTHRVAGRVVIGGTNLTIADLDEMLFAIDGVLNFSAEVIREHGHDRLLIKLQSVGDHEAAITAARTALAALPLDVQILPVDVLPVSMAKRTIFDHRTSL